jgi:transcriptional regulator with PAS, ATPase and Fis domain
MSHPLKLVAVSDSTARQGTAVEALPVEAAHCKPSLITLPHPEGSRSVRASALVFEDPASVSLLQRIQRIAPSEANVLIIGDTGTGKELIARHVHALSQRRDGPFAAVNCGALSETLAEGELFGHEKGAFTSACRAKTGWFETANGGTLFLDEIGDLSLNIQVKLLRVLQEREVVRVGSCTPIPINVRLIAATNVRLEEAVLAGNFREDLFYRLQVVRLALAPLRERPGDILPLVHYFVDQYSQRLGLGQITIPLATEAKLLAHAWPGNIRELENAIHHGLLVTQNGVLRPEDVHLFSFLSTRAVEVEEAPPRETSQAVAQIEKALQTLFGENHDARFEHIEGIVLQAAYEYCHRNQVQAARLLGISRNVIRARLIKQGIISALK